jgi:hypothetical protein
MPQAIRPDLFANTDEPFPLTPNGKLDRAEIIKAVKKIEEGALPPSANESNDVKDEFEEWVIELWGDLIGRVVGRSSNLFDEGGHSLTLARTVSEAKEDLGLSLRMSDLYEDSTPSGIASIMRKEAVRVLED